MESKKQVRLAPAKKEPETKSSIFKINIKTSQTLPTEEVFSTQPQNVEVPRSLEEQQKLKRKGELSTEEKGAKEQKAEEEEEETILT